MSSTIPLPTWLNRQSVVRPSDDIPPNSFFELAKKGAWKEIAKLIDANDERLHELHLSTTALHVLILHGKDKLAAKLAKKFPLYLIHCLDHDGYSVLARAACFGTCINAAKAMVKTYPPLLRRGTRTNRYLIPLVLASLSGYKEMVRFLYYESMSQDRGSLAETADILAARGFQLGYVFLFNCLSNDIFDVALDYLERSEGLFHTRDKVSFYCKWCVQFAHKTYAFRSGSQLGFWAKLIYNMIPVGRSSQGYGKQKWTLAGLLEFFGLKKIHDEKLTHFHAFKLLKYMAEKIQNVDPLILQHGSVYEAVLDAAKNGNLEFLELMIGLRPQLAQVVDRDNRGIVAYAILHRQVEVFNFICEHNASGGLRTNHVDANSNNHLHLAAMLGPSPKHGWKSCAAFKMQEELQWFEAGKAIVHPNCIGALNGSGKTADQIFIEDHERLMEEAENWSKENARSLSAIAVLLITIMFPAMLVRPGGNNEGFPFTLYVISNLTSLLLASFSLLAFLGIQITLYSGIGLHKSLPRVFIIALFTLHLSTASMVATSCAAVSLNVTGHPYIMKFAISLVCLLVIIFLPLQFHISIEILKSSLNKMKVLNCQRV